jgi:hypothetical protein
VTPADIQKIYEWCVAHQGEPYVFGGGGDPRFLPSGSPVKGYDCSKLLSAAIHAGAPQEMPTPLGTHELERWGLAGEGAHMTLWVVNGFVNGIPTEHCVLEFPQAPLDRRFFMAFFTGGPPSGFLSSFDTTHYHARRKVVG